MRPPFLARAIEFRNRKTVLKSCLTAVQMPQLQMHTDYPAESDSKLARDADPIVAVQKTFNRVSPVVPATVANWLHRPLHLHARGAASLAKAHLAVLLD
jgi:hypothetical protein